MFSGSLLSKYGLHVDLFVPESLQYSERGQELPHYVTPVRHVSLDGLEFRTQFEIVEWDTEPVQSREDCHSGHSYTQVRETESSPPVLPVSDSQETHGGCRTKDPVRTPGVIGVRYVLIFPFRITNSNDLPGIVHGT